MSDLSAARRSGHTGRSYWQALVQAVVAASLVHVAFCALFFALSAPLMGWANVGSIVLYGAAYALLRKRYNRPALALIWVELLTHALVATRVLGWESGFHYYVLLMMPMVFMSPVRGEHTKVVLGLLLAVFYLGLDWMSHHRAPLAVLTPGALDGVRAFNIVATLVLLAHLANYYLRAVMRAEMRLHDLATTDPLTGLANRRRALDVAGLHLARRRSDGAPMSVILGDVDHFKSVNDWHGHEVGDQVLIAVAKAMQSATRDGDTVCRWGGEEFLIVLPDTDAAEALRVAERVRHAVQHTHLAQADQALSVTITLGVSTLQALEPLSAGIARADAAMYRGKIAGRNRCEGDAPPAPSLPRREPALAH
ncbi:GGDEF domain-containing protein [Piscinibacter sp. HJYY11]|uniref:GGDEF domain-containing protein n=1 Tax=Piscinibacter sp. HJYY11 TaxID=2801333 RepID=UPI00191FD1F0|nr:GGDEF domain-containing protein [Piscinibacter sp. HJYY11]MBL0729305.1 GGDEF domain-containing protein [Piscinibacter sp. HJYY11]